MAAKEVKPMIYSAWVFRDARWWQFWRPQSGLPGGLILGTGIYLVLRVVFWVVLR